MLQEIEFINDAREHEKYEDIMHEVEADIFGKFSTSQEEMENLKILKEEGQDACNDHMDDLRWKYFVKELKRRGHLVELDECSEQFKHTYTLLLEIPTS